MRGPATAASYSFPPSHNPPHPPHTATVPPRSARSDKSSAPPSTPAPAAPGIRVHVIHGFLGALWRRAQSYARGQARAAAETEERFKHMFLSLSARVRRLPSTRHGCGSHLRWFSELHFRAYKYVSEAYGGHHFDVSHGLNVDAGIFVSYIGRKRRNGSP